MSETLQPEKSDEGMDRFQQMMENDKLGRPQTYQDGLETAHQANKMYDLHKAHAANTRRLYDAASAVATDAILHDKSWSDSKSPNLWKVPEVGPRLERANRKEQEAELAFKALVDVAGSQLTHDEDLEARESQKPSSE